MMKKSLLALAVAGLSANAFAASLDYTLPTAPTVNTIAKEVVTVTTSTPLTTVDTIKFPLQFSATNQNLVRIDLSNGAKFTAAPTLAAGGLSSSISEGGAGASFAVFQLNGTGTEAQTSVVTLTLAGLTVANQGDIGIEYRLYDNQVDAHNATTRTLADKNYAYATFANALVFTANNPGTSKQIDVAQNSKRFVSGTTSLAFGGLNLAVKDSTYGADLSAPLDLLGVIGANAVVTVTGDFSAIAASAAGSTLGGLAATGVNTAKSAVTFSLGATPIALADAPLVYAVDAANTGIAPSEFNAKLTLGTGATLTAAPADVANFATLAKNGDTDYVDLALKPGGAFSDYVRISNKSSIAGNVFLTVINDNGDKASIKLSDIAGQTTSLLGANASTSQITIQSIFDAAAAKGLTLTGDQKLRLVVDAEFTDVAVQSYTISTDGTTFSTFK